MTSAGHGVDDGDDGLLHGYGEGEGEVYLNVVKGDVRRKRGPRAKPRGPYSGAEKAMKKSIGYFIAATHWMDGELADKLALHFAATFAAYQTVVERYSYKMLPDPGPEDWEALKEELGIAEVEHSAPDDEFDVGDLM